MGLSQKRRRTVGIALDAAGAVCQFVRRQGTWEQIFDTITSSTGDVPALVDSTGVGDPILERLQRVTTDVFQRFHFSAPAKQQLMEGLAVAIQQRRVRYPDGPITSELETFEYEYTRAGVRYCAPAGLHDDCVCALALAVRLEMTEDEREPFQLINGQTPPDRAAWFRSFERFLCPPRPWSLPIDAQPTSSPNDTGDDREDKNG